MTFNFPTQRPDRRTVRPTEYDFDPAQKELIFARSRMALSDANLPDLDRQYADITRKTVASARHGTIPASQVATTTDSFHLLTNVEHVVEAHVSAIQRADKEILIQTYGWNFNAPGSVAVLEAISNRVRERDAAAGASPLKIRFLVNELGHLPLKVMQGTRESADHVPHGPVRDYRIDKHYVLGPKYTELLKDCDIQVRSHRHTSVNSEHAKSAVIDDAVIFTGMNFQGGFFKRGAHYDAGLVLTGQAAEVAHEDFADRWNRGANKARHEPTQDMARRDKLVDTRSPQRDTVPILIATQKPTRNILSTSTRSPADQAILAAIGNARQSIQIMTPNLNSKAVVDAIARAANRGVTVKILLSIDHNSDRQNMPFAGGDNGKAIAKLESKTRHSADLEIRYFINPFDMEGASSHAKLLVADGTLISGSSNLDKASIHFSGETNAVVMHPEAARLVNENIFEPSWLESVPHYLAQRANDQPILAEAAPLAAALPEPVPMDVENKGAVPAGARNGVTEVGVQVGSDEEPSHQSTYL